MKWEDQRRSDNVEDRRSGGGGMPGGGGIRLGGGVGIGTIIIAFLAAWIFGINPATIIGVLGGGGAGPAVSAPQAPARQPPADDQASNFVRSVLASTEDVWRVQMSKAGVPYKDPKLVLFRGVTQSGCGMGQSAMGPFYCPADQKIYIDLNFFETMRTKLGSGGDFAYAYVVAHEVAHHVQNQLGITGKVDAMRGRVSETQMNQLSVRVELQADCLAGVWTHHSQQGKGWLEQGDLEEAMNAASQIGDDMMQRRGGGYVVPESFTHGSSKQRVEWFRRGVQSGSVQQCNTFDAQRL
jgi:uncharacterized protein